MRCHILAILSQALHNVAAMCRHLITDTKHIADRATIWIMRTCLGTVIVDS